jgi:thioredoxin reductase (NADPH)
MEWDVIIIGGGPAGLTAGLYAARARLKTLLLEKLVPGGQASTTAEIENYPGAGKGITGPELTQRMEEQAREFGMEIINKEVNEIKLSGRKRIVKCGSEEFVAKAVIIATGAEPRKLGVPGEDGFRGRGVSYCATCDGAFFTGKRVMVVGGGDTAIEEALFLTRFAEKVIVVHRRDQLRATRVLQDRAFKNKKIEVIWDSVVKEIKGKELVEEVILENVKTGETVNVPADGVFVAIGYSPSTGFLKGLVELDENGYVITDDNMQTNIPGVFAAGDLRQKPLRQVVTAVSDGAVAAVSASRYIEDMEK